MENFPTGYLTTKPTFYIFLVPTKKLTSIKNNFQPTSITGKEIILEASTNKQSIKRIKIKKRIDDPKKWAEDFKNKSDSTGKKERWLPEIQELLREKKGK